MDKDTELEEQFRKDVTEKLKQAGDLILEAQKIAKDNNDDLLDMWREVYPLFDAMDEVGWRTSSLSC